MLATGRLPECRYIPRAQVLEWRALLELYQDLRTQHSGWAQRIQAVCFHQGAAAPGQAGIVRGDRARLKAIVDEQLTVSGRLRVNTAPAVMDVLAEHGRRPVQRDDHLEQRHPGRFRTTRRGTSGGRRPDERDPNLSAGRRRRRQRGPDRLGKHPDEPGHPAGVAAAPQTPDGRVVPRNPPPASAVFEGRALAALARLFGVSFGGAKSFGGAEVGTGVVVAQAAAVHDLGGRGKSELANHYARTYLGRYRLAWWITADNLQAVGLAWRP